MRSIESPRRQLSIDLQQRRKNFSFIALRADVRLFSLATRHDATNATVKTCGFEPNG
jgi:hypothetical protein